MVLRIIKKKFLEILLWFSRISTPEEGPDIQTSRENNSNWWGPLPEIDTGYGFLIDKTDPSIKFIDWILQKIEIWDERPTILPSETAAHIERKYMDRIPKEVTRPKDLDVFLWSMTGSYFLEPTNELDTYVVDLSHYEKYEVRPGFEKYGGKAYLKNGKIIRYEYLGKVYPSDDSFAQKIIQASLCLKMMVELHALRIHLGTSQRKTFEYRKNYDINSPLIDFLYLATYGTLDVNRRIPVLVGPSGLVVRLFALTQESYLDLLENVLAKPAFSEEEYLGIDHTPWNDQIRNYQEKVRKLVKKLSLDLKSSFNDKLEYKQNINDLTDFFVSVTALHNQFGDAQIYSMAVSDFFLPKIYTENPGYISKLDQDLLSTLLVSVSPRYPLIIDPESEKIFTSFKQQKAWIKFAKEISKINSPWFNPNYFETSVGF